MVIIRQSTVKINIFQEQFEKAFYAMVTFVECLHSMVSWNWNTNFVLNSPQAHTSQFVAFSCLSFHQTKCSLNEDVTGNTGPQIIMQSNTREGQILLRKLYTQCRRPSLFSQRHCAIVSDESSCIIILLEMLPYKDVIIKMLFQVELRHMQAFLLLNTQLCWSFYELFKRNPLCAYISAHWEQSLWYGMHV